MKTILQQDDCAPDLLQRFDEEFNDTVGESRSDFMKTAKLYSNRHTICYTKGIYELSISNSDPYWSLKESTSTSLRVFKFYSGKHHYAYSGRTQGEAKDCMFEQIGEMTIDRVEEIPKSQWDDKIISVWEDDDMDNECHVTSIRDQIIGDDPQLIFTNDLGLDL